MSHRSFKEDNSNDIIHDVKITTPHNKSILWISGEKLHTHRYNSTTGEYLDIEELANKGKGFSYKTKRWHYEKT